MFRYEEDSYNQAVPLNFFLDPDKKTLPMK